MLPARSWPSWMPATVTIGISALRSAWRKSTHPLGQALGARRLHVLLAEHLQHRRAGGARQDRELEEAERHRGQQQRAQRRARTPAPQPSKPPACTQPSRTEKSRIRSRPGPEAGHRDAELGEGHRQVVAPAAVPGGREDPERDRGRDHQPGGQQRERQGHGEARQDQGRRPAGRTGSSGPRSPRRARPTHCAYWTGIGRSRPRACRTRATESGLASRPRMMRAGRRAARGPPRRPSSETKKRVAASAPTPGGRRTAARPGATSARPPRTGRGPGAAGPSRCRSRPSW